MTVATVEFMSEALWRQVTYMAILPDTDIPGPYPVLYLLHGGNQNYSSWLHYSRLLSYVHDMPFIVILPDGAQTRWANMGNPFTRYEDFIVEDLPNHVKRNFHASTGKCAISGNSMGGGGAVRMGLKYPHLFFSIWAHSGGFPSSTTLAEHWYWTGNPEAVDCYTIIDNLDINSMPRLSFDCGENDHLLEENRHYHAFLEQHGIPHAYYEHPGAHNWDYWDAHLPESLKQHLDEWTRLQNSGQNS